MSNLSFENVQAIWTSLLIFARSPEMSSQMKMINLSPQEAKKKQTSS